MPIFCINQKEQQNGDHEVHDLTPGRCTRLPDTQNRLDLGSHTNCASAVQQAKRTYSRSNGCYHRSPSCHTT